MKSIITPLFFLLTSLSVCASDTIFLRPISYNQVFELAKKENKHVMLYFHFDGCGACVQMEKTAFADPDVAAFYNSNFVSLDVNTKKGEGIETNKIYNVLMHPTFLYLDHDGNILHKIVGVYTPQEFIQQAGNTLSNKSTYTLMKKEYQSGNRNPDFLYDYCYMLRDVIEEDSAIINEYLATQSNDDLFLEKNIKFIYEFALLNHDATMPYTSRYFQFMDSHVDEFMKFFDEEQIKTRIVWITTEHLYNCIERKDEKCFNEVLATIRPYERQKYYEYKEMDGRPTGILFGNKIITDAKLAYYKKVGKLKEYDEALMGYINSIWDNADQLNSLAWDYYETQSSAEDLEKAIGWVKRSIELDHNYFNADTYAALLYKTGKYKEALKQAKEAIELAKQSEDDYTTTTALIAQIKEARR